jgi:hypothetical protein
VLPRASKGHADLTSSPPSSLLLTFKLLSHKFKIFLERE